MECGGRVQLSRFKQEGRAYAQRYVCTDQSSLRLSGGAGFEIVYTGKQFGLCAANSTRRLGPKHCGLSKIVASSGALLGMCPSHGSSGSPSLSAAESPFFASRTCVYCTRTIRNAAEGTVLEAISALFQFLFTERVSAGRAPVFAFH
ncbi:hypothetical protein MRX96_034935 [Rhipicephalus microplus]